MDWKDDETMMFWCHTTWTNRFGNSVATMQQFARDALFSRSCGAGKASIKYQVQDDRQIFMAPFSVSATTRLFDLNGWFGLLHFACVSRRRRHLAAKHCTLTD